MAMATRTTIKYFMFSIKNEIKSNVVKQTGYSHISNTQSFPKEVY